MVMTPTSRGDEAIEQRERHLLGQRTGFADRTDAVGTAVLALAARNQLARVGEQLIVHAEQRLAEADAAGIVVVDEDARLVELRAGPTAAPRPAPSAASSSPLPIEMPMSCRSHISSSCATCRIANDSPTTPSRRSSALNGSAAISSRGSVSQYAVVCICCSGRSSSPEPTFSFV